MVPDARCGGPIRFRTAARCCILKGAGQKTEVWAGLKRVGRHVGGYDEWVVDITDAAAGLKEIPIAVFCDNSRDLEMIPSSLSDFNLYGGLYRYVNLRYVPPVSIERVHVRDGVVSARLYNPAGLKDEVNLDIRITDPSGKVVHASSRKLKPWVGSSQSRNSRSNRRNSGLRRSRCFIVAS